jgi:hypothetical protein
MIRPTKAETAQVEMLLVQQRGAIPARYTVTVIPMDDDGRWWPHVRIVDDTGNIVKDAGNTAVRFPTSAAAEHAGWAFVAAWIRSRTTT